MKEKHNSTQELETRDHGDISPALSENDQTGRPAADQKSAKAPSSLRNVLEAHRGERHVIVLHDYPDPDAIASAFAHALLSTQFEIETTIIYNGKISHQQNIAMVRILGIDLTRYDQPIDLKQFDGAIFVDNQGTSAEKIVQALEEAGVPPLIVVDHHELQERLKAEFSDIRRIGSSSTIYAEYLRDLVQLDKSQKAHIMVATALTQGIITDTGGFIRAGVEDFYAAAYLSSYNDADLLGQIMSQSRSRQVMDIIRRALEGRLVAESYSIASIGYVRSEDRDAIPQAADFLLTEENIHTAIVYGIVTDEERGEALVGSLRTSKITIDPDAFIKDTFGKDWSGNYFGGGKISAGAFEIPIGFLSGNNTSDEYQNLKWNVYDRQIKQKIFNKTGIKLDGEA
ncbi:MAG: bifunctional oligoribonuclease/PAP phosphatase NrnA [Anaerolineae bacterium]|nr:bifunctional oligoribonuclease/PAP phosphatase NrnA [Anaerolineae bacterium]MCB0213205.1 bifunctional oligoribonuclease/PAP phosphatase NrnA [Anaerolineae bacterium]MCB0223221.1 bifunctional oligoribonuclease/PAP phosphatase NrnA [Anaerolineae bacterium]